MSQEARDAAIESRAIAEQSAAAAQRAEQQAAAAARKARDASERSERIFNKSQTK
jgi:hypothetical protein